MPSKSPSSARLWTLLCARGRHEQALRRRHAIERMQDHHVDMLRSGKGGSGCAARIARRGAQDGHALAALFEHVVVELRDQAHRHVLERQRRAVMQLQHPAAGADFGQRRNGLVREGGVGALRHAADGGFRHGAAGEGREDARGGFHIAVADLGTRDLRPRGRAVEAAIRRKAVEAGRQEIDCFGCAACGNVVHSPALPSGAFPKRRRPARACMSPYIRANAIAIPNQVTA